MVKKSFSSTFACSRDRVLPATRKCRSHPKP
jgi:hypothetical protein